METDTNRIEYCVDVLTRVLKSEQKRLKNGIAIRQLIKDRLEQGLPVSHYRLDWLRVNRVRLAAVLQVFGKEFNNAHPKDKISNHDFVDLLTSVINGIVKVS